MKNVLNYYYQINFSDIHQNGNHYYFINNHNLYYFMLYERNIEEVNELYEIANELLKRHVYCHQIIPNKNNQLLTFVNGATYILMKVFVDPKKVVGINDIIIFTYQTMGITNRKKIKKNDWKLLWSNKIDYLEYQINKLGKKYPLIRDSFSYFVGLAENSITLLNGYKDEAIIMSVSHQRIKKNYTAFELYNPLNFIIDIRIRDACEYFKSCFLTNSHVLEMIKKYVSYNNLTANECLFFFARMLFPTFYFDIYEDVINGDADEKELILIINKIEDYEELLANLYYYFKNVFSIDNIDWIISKKKTPFI